jgi:hypothetical protein
MRAWTCAPVMLATASCMRAASASDLVDQVDAFPLQDEERGRIGAEDKVVDPDRVDRAARRRRMVAGGWKSMIIERWPFRLLGN